MQKSEGKIPTQSARGPLSSKFTRAQAAECRWKV
jgi:hypothetical protein